MTWSTSVGNQALRDHRPSIAVKSDDHRPSKLRAVSLHGRPIEETAALPDGREVRIRVGMQEDSYLAERELQTVDVELFAGEEPLAAVSTVLLPEQESEALALARRIAAGLSSGELEPTAAAIEPLADDPG